MKLDEIFINHDEYQIIEEQENVAPNEGTFIVVRKADQTRFLAQIYKSQQQINSKEQLLIIQDVMNIKKFTHPVICPIEGLSFYSFSNPLLMEPTILTKYFAGIHENNHQFKKEEIPKYLGSEKLSFSENIIQILS